MAQEQFVEFFISVCQNKSNYEKIDTVSHIIVSTNVDTLFCQTLYVTWLNWKKFHSKSFLKASIAT
jgi:hypothetical protein